MFIPNRIMIGDRYRLKTEVQTLAGVFTAGHEFKVIGISDRGPDLEDDEGNRLLETGLIFADSFWRL